MRIAKEQFDALVAKLDALQLNVGACTEKGSLHDRFYKLRDQLNKVLMPRIDAIEQAQGVLCERLDEVSEILGKVREAQDENINYLSTRIEEIERKLDTLAAATREKRTWIYVQRPKDYDIAPHGCGHTDPDWSEYKNNLWCPACQVDFVPEHYGVLDGPVAINLCKMLGICFDRFNLLTGKVEPFEPSGKEKAAAAKKPAKRTKR
jgi:hypothetical protein